MPTRAELAKIHIGAKEIGLGEAAYRNMLRDRYGAESAQDLTAAQVRDLLAHFRRCGWRPRPPRRAKSAGLAADPQSRKIRALWITLHRVGLVRDPSEQALGKYVQRMTKSSTMPRGVAALQWCDARQKRRVIEALKSWLARAN